MFSLQLAHLAGYKVVTVASPRNFELCKSLGADAVFDVGAFSLYYSRRTRLTQRSSQYKDPETPNKIKEVTNNSLHLAFDAISQASSEEFTANTFGPGPGKIITILPSQVTPQKEEGIRDDIQVKCKISFTHSL